MKTLILVLGLVISLNASAAKALGDKIGNGGGLWACMKNGMLEKAELVDLFEAKTEFKLNIPQPSSTDPISIYNEKKDWLYFNVPKLHSLLEPYFKNTENSMSIVNGELRIVDDLLYRIKPAPEDCPGGSWEYKQFANFTHDGNLLIQKNLWQSTIINPLDKAALLIHESIYHMLRDRNNDIDSVRSRKLVGLIFSDLPQQLILDKINDLLSLDGADPGTIVDKLGFFLKVSTPNLQNSTKLHIADAPYGKTIGTKNFKSECVIPHGTNGTAADILCVLEIEELDLYFSNLEIQAHVPSDTCSYLKFTPYHFYQREAGKGPNLVSYTVTKSGKIINEVNSKNGTPKCKYDYSDKINGPNCCEGEFVEKIKYLTDGSTTTTTKSWGGSAGNCLVGPAIDSQARSSYGYPISSIYYVDGTGYNRNYTINSSADTGRVSNLWASNFYNPASFKGGKPLALLPPSTISKNAYTPSDTYEWKCLDRAEDLVARIRLIIREWNGDEIGEGRNPERGDSERKSWSDLGDKFPNLDL